MLDAVESLPRVLVDDTMLARLLYNADAGRKALLIHVPEGAKSVWDLIRRLCVLCSADVLQSVALICGLLSLMGARVAQMLVSVQHCWPPASRSRVKTCVLVFFSHVAQDSLWAIQGAVGH